MLVTDGDGSIPLALPGDKARTSAILIPPDCDPGAMSQIAARVVTLGDLRGLTDVLALLTPRTCSLVKVALMSPAVFKMPALSPAASTLSCAARFAVWA